MSFYQTIRSGLLALFHVSAAEPESGDAEVTLDDVRALMLDMVGQPTENSATLVRRIRYATDPQALWFMRSELMALLAHKEGEAIARTKLEVLSDMFRELLPRGLRSRPSPLFGGNHGGQSGGHSGGQSDRGDSLPR